jgi:hypothetical protein
MKVLNRLSIHGFIMLYSCLETGDINILVQAEILANGYSSLTLLTHLLFVTKSVVLLYDGPMLSHSSCPL